MNKERLIKLAKHLGKSREKHLHKFNMNTVNQDLESIGFQTVKGVENCGSIGCAIGECPLIFPDLVSFNPQKPKFFNLVGHEDLLSYGSVGALLFDISFHEAATLFTPFTSQPWDSDKTLTDITNPKAVARLIRKFIEWKEKTHE